MNDLLNWPYSTDAAESSPAASSGCASGAGRQAGTVRSRSRSGFDEADALLDDLTTAFAFCSAVPQETNQ